jgi:hypothetical protein
VFGVAEVVEGDLDEPKVGNLGLGDRFAWRLSYMVRAPLKQNVI